MKQIKIWLLVALIGIITFSVVVSTNQSKNSKTIKIGAALSFTGDASAWGAPSLNGAKLAVDEINANGGINGKKLELIIEDSKSTSKDTLAAVTKLQNINKVDALLVTWLDIYQGAESVLNEKTFIISPDAGIEGVNGKKINPRVYSTWYRTQPKTELSIKHMAENGVKTLYVITENDSYCMSVVEFINEAAKKYGIEIVGTDLPLDAESLKSVLVKVKEKNPDAVWFAFYDDQKNHEFLKNIRNMTKKDVKIYSDELIPQHLNNDAFIKESLEGIYFHTPVSPDVKFYTNYKNTYNQEPIFSSSTTYDAVYIAAKIIENSPDDIDKYVQSTTFDTASYGQITIDSIGGVKSLNNSYEIKRVVNGEIITQ